jgi:hypothetical protein
MATRPQDRGIQAATLGRRLREHRRTRLSEPDNRPALVQRQPALGDRPRAPQLIDERPVDLFADAVVSRHRQLPGPSSVDPSTASALSQIPVERSPMLLDHNSGPRVFDFTMLHLIHVIVDAAG